MDYVKTVVECNCICLWSIS